MPGGGDTVGIRFSDANMTIHNLSVNRTTKLLTLTLIGTKSGLEIFPILSLYSGQRRSFGLISILSTYV